MKEILIVALMLAITATIFGQNFEGKIIYQNSYKSKIPNITDELLSDMAGTKQEYYIKGGNYKSVMNGIAFQWQLYINEDNKLYNKMTDSETILWNDGSVNEGSVIAVKINKNVIEILGYQCDELILTCKNGIQKYYFAPKLGVDSQLYINHKYGNWYEFLTHANALALKMIIEDEEFTMEGVATEIAPMKLGDKIFQLPKNAKTAKSPY